MAGSLTRLLLTLLLSATALPAIAQSDDALPLLVIIIDDLGHRYREGIRAVDLPGAVSCSVLPMTPYGRQLAGRAHSQGKEIMLHLPLAADAVDDEVPGGIELDTSEVAMQRIVSENLDWLPVATGVNNHRGSLLTRHPGHMDWLMNILAQRDLFFVDSRTTPHTIALQLAREHGVAATRRDIFLDNVAETDAIEAALLAAVEKAKQTGSAVAIGHPYPQTLEVLEAWLPDIEMLGVRLATVEEVIRLRAAAQMDAPQPELSAEVKQLDR